ncbi:hypothetical protein BC834DRAFT_636721 [Gloeopeniophorella convolvens]|nr:hypothetical protein BC834DRAFT_636721 [Gloeopeniophorella convolvens]
MIQRPTRELAQTALFTQRSEDLPIADRVRLSYQRARAIGRAYALTAEDVLFLSPKFWALHTDPIAGIDGAAATLLTIQYNLCAGTLATHVHEQPELAPLLQRVLDFDVSGQFCLTEVGHGLDVIHMETTATQLPDGSFELHTPVGSAAKFMPPTSPVSPGFPCVSVVFAHTYVNGEDHGVKPFVFQLHDGQIVTPGVSIKLLPSRGGSRPVNHSLTYFNRVRLPPTALLGNVDKKPRDIRAAFFRNIYRVAVGTIALSSLGMLSLQVASYIAARYSLRRTVVDPSGVPRPILEFHTQKTPILTALAQSFVLHEMHEQCVAWFCDPSLDPRVRHAVATVHKVAMIQTAQEANFALGDRCGAQGLFEANQLSAMHSDMRGIAIAEGDLLGISIRTCCPDPTLSCPTANVRPARPAGLASELILGRYAIEPPRYPDSLLARHEAGLFAELRAALRAAPGGHRGAAYGRALLPRAMPLVHAIGQRVAYDAARVAALDAPLLALFEAAAVLQDEAWYVECAGARRAALRAAEADAVEAVLPHLEEYLERMDVEPYIVAPIVSDKRWTQFVGGLTTFGEARGVWAVGPGTGEEAEAPAPVTALAPAALLSSDVSMASMREPHRGVRSML